MAPLFQRISVPIDSAQWRLIRRYLLNMEEESDDERDTTNDSSQWEDVDSDSDNSEEKPDGNQHPASRTNLRQTPWLQTIHMATIPTFELFVFAHGTRILALEANGNGQWKILYQKEVREEISAVTCLPVAPTRMSDPRPYEWTAVLVGTEDGYLLALNERGDEILNHRFHTKPVIELRLQADQLFVAYPDYLNAVSGLTLLAVLKANRQRLFRHHRGLDHQQGDAFPSVDSQLVHEFWRLENVSQPISVAATGPHRTSIWEKMVTASVKGGFNASISSRQPSYETYCATNTKNFVSFNWWTDETPPNLLAGVASRIKTSLSVPTFVSSWWSPSKANKADGTSAVVAPITSRDVPQRSHLPDSGRIGERLVLAPGDRLAAICDDLGRVCLVEVHRRLLLRMWKGYRDAQCAWIELPYSGQEKKDGEKNRCNVLCLVIYAPRRGILEVWSAQNGRRAAAFNVDRQGILVYCPATTLTKSSSINFSQATRFLDSNGQFFHIDISASIVIEPHETTTYWTMPAKEEFRKQWHGSLVEESQLAVLLDILGRLTWTKDIGYLVDHVIPASKIDYKLFVRFVEAVIARLAKDQEQHPDVRALYARCLVYRQITNFAALMLKYHDPKFRGDDSEGEESEGEVYQFLSLQSPEELDGLLRDLDGNLKIRSASTEDSIALDPSRILNEFLSSIDYRSLAHVPFTSSPTFSEQTLRLRLKKDVDDATVLAELGDFVFKPFLDGTCSVDEFRRNAQPLLGLVDREWTRLFCSFWLHKNRSYSVHPVRLYNLFRILSTREDGKRELGSDFLREVRRSIIDCSRIAEALSLCMVVRAMVRNTVSKEGDSDWMKIEKDVEDWDILQTTLHSVLLIDTCCRHVTAEASQKGKNQEESISLRQLLLTGAGFLSEHLAKSFVSAGRLIEGNQFNNLSSEESSESWIMALERSREILPLSLETERLVLGILWEYVRVWHKNPTREDCLTAASSLLGDVQDERMRQGFASLAWRTFFRQHYEKLCNAMMASNGKDCSDAFERETGVPATGLPEFVRFVYTLFNVMKESVERYQEGASKRYETEEYLNNFFLAFRHDVAEERTGNRESLWDLLSRQPANSKSQIYLHWQLAASVLVAISTSFETRQTPLTLFSWDQRSDLFKSISVGSRGDDNAALSDEDTEQQQLDNRRLLFLLTYVTVAIKRSLPSISSAEDTSEKNLLPDLSLAVKLARAWGLNFDAVRRQEVAQLYLAGYPDLASKLLPLVEDRRQLASTLLDIAGCALSDRWASSPTMVRPNMSAGLWQWLMARKSSTNAKGPELSLDACSSMLAFVCSSMSPASAESKMCDELREVIEKLK